MVGFFGFLRQTLVELWQAVLPPRYFSWQTVIYMSLFSWLMSLLARLLAATPFTVGLLATISWICLALGVGWALEANKVRFFGIPVAPWVSGAIICIFLFGSWGGRWLQPALVSWPLVSFAVIAVPSLLSWDFDLKTPPPMVRQQLALLFCLSLLFSSWFQFYFRIQSWVRDYPSLVADSVDNSAFVYRFPGQEVALPAGVTHLTIAEEVLREQIDNKPWPSVERWLLNLEGQRQALQRRVQSQMGRGASLENSLWRLDFQPLSNADGYTLKLWAIWSGPAANQNGYYLEKTCLLMPVNRGGLVDTENAAPGYTTTQWSTLTCDLQTPRQAGHPRGTQQQG
ncbi:MULTISPECIES: DUF5357 family protein [Cyanophyceae]|uniref:DUF5357 domain-containing protein n=1 Tax=Leptolyngbya subtilissima DQ-A4 TaxID=2933933 RepID=A0ABV0KB01_9CYAN|nr:DUF5357 family protein [Nodosilinea sp. FACHB-141]MBD2114100.1 DUF5357 family protein [Nodosilinea sp. FACHB-141]